MLEKLSNEELELLAADACERAVGSDDKEYVMKQMDFAICCLAVIEARRKSVVMEGAQ